MSDRQPGLRPPRSGNFPLDRAKLFGAFQALWIWQDQLMWSRTRLLLGLQAATLAAAYQLRSHLGGPALLLLACFLTFLLRRLAVLDERNRNRTRSLMDAIIPEKEFRERFPTDPSALPPLPIDPSTPTGYRTRSGGGIIRTVMDTFIAVDLALAILGFALLQVAPSAGTARDSRQPVNPIHAAAPTAADHAGIGISISVNAPAEVSGASPESAFRPSPTARPTPTHGLPRVQP